MLQKKLAAAGVALLAGIGLSAPANAVSVELAYGGTTVQLNDGDAGDQNANPGIVEYQEGPSGANFTDFADLVLQGSLCNFCPSRINLESEAGLGVADAQSDLILRVSDNNFNLTTALNWLAESDFTSILGGVSADYSTFWDPGNALFGTTTLLDTDTLSGTDASALTSIIGSPASPFSLTIEVVFPEAQLEASTQTLLSTAQLRTSVVPLPASALFLLTGLGGLGFLARRRKAAAA